MSLINSTQQSGYADDLFGFPRFDDKVRETSKFPIHPGFSEFVPEINFGYVFRKKHLHVLQFWANGTPRNILLNGETGTGKTTLVEQLAARLNWPVFPVACHGDLEFQEFIGRITLQSDGSTGWVDGPLIAAMRHGGIFLLDEMNFLDPDVAGGLNFVLQAASYVIPETGELVVANEWFRIAATGNAIDGVSKSSYQGTKRGNIALLARFTIGIRVKYMSTADEALMIQAQAPRISPKIANYLAEIASMSRKSYEEGVIAAPLSPRETISSAERMVAFSGNVKNADDAFQAQCKSASIAFEMSFMYRWSPEDQMEFTKAANSVAQHLGIPVTLELEH